MKERKDHWENIYTTKQSHEVSWTQSFPYASINYIKLLQLPLTSRVIDVGGGDSNLVDHLSELGYTNLTVVDISEKALERAKEKMGKRSGSISWIVADINEFEPSDKFDFWHDRAAFHFLTEPLQIRNYIQLVSKSLKQGGDFLLGTFSDEGPLKCSGLNITQYSESAMIRTFSEKFVPVKCFSEDHKTPFDTIQKFQFCGFRRL